jgi:bifunctional DNA-binding transcriptional regulator/antitoxin component of YhaV-PrlF toxin-antitoxin module
MPTYHAVVDEAGRVTLPEELVQRLAIKAGEKVEFFLTLDGHVHFHVVNRSWRAFAENIGPPHRPSLSIREIDDAISDHLAEKHDLIGRRSHPSDDAERSAAE